MRRLFVTLLAAGWLVVTASSARADDASDCVDANERSIVLRKEHKLLEARAATAKCSATTCAEDVRRICAERAERISEALPSIVFEVKDAEGHDLSGVRVTVDGGVASTDPTVMAVELDPGPHSFVFEVSGQSLARSFVLREGERMRREPIVAPALHPVAAAPPPEAPPAPLPSPPPSDRSLGATRTVGLMVGGAGVAALAVGSIFGVLAINAHSNYETSCGSHIGAPAGYCNANGVAGADDAANKGTLSTVFFVGGAVAACVGTAMFLLFPGHAGDVQVGVGPGRVAVEGRF